MTIKSWKKEVFTIPNILSLFRFLLIPVYICLYFKASDQRPELYYISAGILALSCLTDLADGLIARHCNMITNLGKILDPLADKATQLTLVICLALRHPVLWIALGILFVKELFQLIAGMLLLHRGNILKGAQITGKVSTTVLFVSLVALVLFPHISEKTVLWITIADCIFLLTAFVDYILVYIRKDYEPLNNDV